MIAEVSLDGTCHEIGQQTARTTQTQLEAVVNHLKLVAQQEGIKKLSGSDATAVGETAIPPVIWKKKDVK